MKKKARSSPFCVCGDTREEHTLFIWFKLVGPAYALKEHLRGEKK